MRSPLSRSLWPLLCGLAVAVVLSVPLHPARAQQEGEDLKDILEQAGSAEAVQDDNAPGTGSVYGNVYDGATGAPLSGASVILGWPKPADGSEPRQEVQVTEIDGSYEFSSVPPGTYDLTFIKAGYRASTMTGFEVQADQDNQADFPLPPIPSEGGEDVLELDAFVVEASVVDEMMTSLELRMESDQLLNIMSAEDLSKFASADVADALKRVAGVNIVEGQFAIIRGLEDRYSSTTYNGAPVPSPDPDRQSIQLDLFPSEVVSNLVVAKTFGAELPSNSSGGNVNIVTSGYPEGPFELSLAAKTGINENAYDRFLEFESGSPVGNEKDGWDPLEKEFGGSLGGTLHLLDRELRYKAVANYQTGFGTEVGVQEGRAPARFELSQHAPAGDLAFGELSLTDGRFDLTTSKYSEQLTFFAGLGLDLDSQGDQKIDFSWFRTKKNGEEVELRENGYLPGFDYAGLRQELIDDPYSSGVLSTDFWANGTPGQNASLDSWIAGGIGQREFPLPPFSDGPNRGLAWFSADFTQSNSFEVERALDVYQLNGEHDAGRLLDDLKFSWAANYATTSQKEDALGARFRYEPCGISGLPQLACSPGVSGIQDPTGLPMVFPVTRQALGPGQYMVNRGLFASSNDIDEEQYFGRVDGEYEVDPLAWLHTELKGGYWYEESTRDVGSTFLDPNNVTVGNRCNSSPFCTGNSSQFAIFADTPQELGARIFGSDLLRDSSGNLEAARSAQSTASREIQAFNVSGKATLWEWFDLTGGVRLEDIFIESKNDPFQTGNEIDGSPPIYPSKYLLFDRFDNSRRREFFRAPPYNDQILGITVPIGTCRDLAGNPIPGGGQCVDFVDRAELEGILNGQIDERRVLPALGLAFRPVDGLTLRGAYSQTVARPSFREIAYYVSVKPGTDEPTIGNPQLQLSDVESWDARVEYLWGDVGDLVAASYFYKTVQDPIEQIILRDPRILDSASLATYRTYFNNPSEATLQGIELEARKNLGFLSLDWLGLDLWPLDFLHHVSIGGNFTYIDAKVDRSPFELTRSQRFFGTPAGPVRFPRLEPSRRLYNQPEWIANADITLDHPDWGTKVTLAWFAISDVLDAAGGATAFGQDPNVSTLAYTLDQYVDSFQTLDLIVSQELWKGLAVKFTAKNLTDSKRAILYDPDQTVGRIAEREYRLGRDYSLQLSWKFSGFEW